MVRSVSAKSGLPRPLVWLCSIPLAGIPRPGIIMHGDQGAGKTSTAEFLRGVLDPSSVPTLGRPTTEEGFIQQMDHHAIVSLDNIQKLDQTISDAICRAVTGGGHSRRELYTTDQDHCYRYMRTFIINGITVAAISPDLVDRSILIELEAISSDDRKEIESLKKAYEQAKGIIFGGICDTLARAIAIRENQKPLAKLPRMADWCRWGMCIAEALGYSQEEFYQAYQVNRTFQDWEIVSNEPVCQALIIFIDARIGESWEGTATKLYHELTMVALNNDLKDKTWPGAANSFARKLRTVRHNLKAVGYWVQDKKRHGTKLFNIQKT